DGQTHSLGVSSVFAFDAAQDTLRLTEAEQQRVGQLQARVVSFNRNESNIVCPDRYIFVQFKHAGRHHNQLQMMMNIIMWAERLNRTAVLGPFFVKNEWVSHSDLYNFSEIARRYCVVSIDTMRKRLSSRIPLTPVTIACFDGDMCRNSLMHFDFKVKTNLVKIVELSAPWNYVDAHFYLKRCFLRYPKKSKAHIVIINYIAAFMMTRGLSDHAAIYGLLRPSALIAQRVKRFLNHSFGPRGRFFAVHKRHREMTCNDFLTESLPQLRTHFGVTLRSEREQLIRAQCNISIPYLAALHASLGLRLFSYPMFLAHDGQDPYTVPQLKARGARVYEKEHYAQYEDCAYGLCALAVDYFVMTEAEYFSGNAVSTVSDNVCFVRLGRGKACHGMEPAIIRMFSYDVREPYPLGG
ncbi:uncharacterized protein TM35_000061290, partial [Trypanosoma theileri]